MTHGVVALREGGRKRRLLQGSKNEHRTNNSKRLLRSFPPFFPPSLPSYLLDLSQHQGHTLVFKRLKACEETKEDDTCSPDVYFLIVGFLQRE